MSPFSPKPNPSWSYLGYEVYSVSSKLVNTHEKAEEKEFKNGARRKEKRKAEKKKEKRNVSTPLD